MKLRLLIDETEITDLLHQAMPLRIHLSGPDEPERWLELTDPRDADFIENVGLQLRCSGSFKLDVAKVPLADNIRTIRVTVRPVIDTEQTGEATLALEIDLDEADLATFPDLLDRSVAKLVNIALDSERSKLRIPFQRFAAGTTEVSPRLQPVSATKTTLEGTSLAITDRKLMFSVDIGVKLERERAVGEHPTA